MTPTNREHLVELIAMVERGKTREETARNILAALESSGCAVVPVEATEGMLVSGCAALNRAQDDLMAAHLSPAPHAVARTKMRLRHTAMLSASPFKPA